MPTTPGAFSAWGMLKGDIRHDGVATSIAASRTACAIFPASVVERLEDEVSALLQLEGAAATRCASRLQPTCATSARSTR